MTMMATLTEEKRGEERSWNEPGESHHDEVAVHSVHHAPVAWNKGVKVFQPVGTLYGRGEEAAEGGHQGGEEPVGQAVQLDGVESEAQ